MEEKQNSNRVSRRKTVFLTVFSMTGFGVIIALLSFTFDIFSFKENDQAQSQEITLQAKQLDVLGEIVTAVSQQPENDLTATAKASEIFNLEMTLEVLERNKSENVTPEPELPITSPTTIKVITINVLSNSEDNIYRWESDPPEVTEKYVKEGDVAFIPTGNNFFYNYLGTIGYESNEIRYLNFYLYLLSEDAALLVQASIDETWNHRWGFDGRLTFEGYEWERKGQTVNIQTKEWIEVTIDLIEDLDAKPGQKLNGLSFAGNDGNIVYDNVELIGSSE